MMGVLIGLVVGLIVGWSACELLRRFLDLHATEKDAAGWRDRPYSNHRHPEAP